MKLEHSGVSFRFYGRSNGACTVGEVQVKGREVMMSDSVETSCTPKLTIGGVSMNLDSTVTYSAEFTPILTSMSKRHGSVLGGDIIEFIGIGFTDAIPIVHIDDRLCERTVVTDSRIKCTTIDKPFVAGDEPRLRIFIDGLGNVAT